jgi:hypothetical protein
VRRVMHPRECRATVHYNHGVNAGPCKKGDRHSRARGSMIRVYPPDSDCQTLHPQGRRASIISCRFRSLVHLICGAEFRRLVAHTAIVRARDDETMVFQATNCDVPTRILQITALHVVCPECAASPDSGIVPYLARTDRHGVSPRPSDDGEPYISTEGLE